MKILKLHFKNINSFYGKPVTIDFTTSPLSDTGLFIISGPTGAGKSTLLDVITLALYNEIPRFEKGVSKTEIDKLGSIVNAKAAEEPRCEAYAQVEYEVKSGRYRSTWSIAKNRNGNWNNYQMEIARLPEETLLDVKGLSEFPKKNAELIGLNYSQFVKSIILAQGSFAEFLKADRHTRTKLLEDITGTHIYRRLGEQAFARFRQSESNIKTKEEILKGVELRPDEEIARFSARKMELEQLRLEKEKEVERWEKEKNLVASIIDLERHLERIGDERKRLAEESEAFVEKRTLLHAHDSVSRFVAPITHYDHLQVQFKKAGESLEAGKRQIQLLDERKAGLLQLATELVKTPVAESEFIQEVNRFEEEILELEGSIKELRAQARPFVDELSSEARKAEYDWSSLLSSPEYEISLERLGKVKERISAVLSAYAVSFDASQRLRELDQQFQTLTELKNLLSERVRVGNDGKRIRTELDKLAVIVKEKEPELTKVSGQLAEVKLAIDKKNEEWIEETRRENFEMQREQLKEGEPCPLCGSLHHPFLHNYVKRLGSLNDELEKLKKMGKELEQLEKALAVEVQTSKAKTDDLNRQLQEMRVNYKEIDTSVKNGFAKLNLEPAGDASLIEPLILGIQEERDRIERWKKAKDEGRVAERMEQNLRQFAEIRRTVQTLEERRKQKYSGTSVKTDVKELLSNWQGTQSERSEVQRQLVRWTDEAAQLKSELESREQQLLTELKEVGVATIEEARLRLLPDEKYRTLRAEEEKLRQRAKSLEDQQKSFTEDLMQKKSLRQYPDHTFGALNEVLADCKSTFVEVVKELASTQQILQTEEENKKKFNTLLLELEQARKDHRKWELLRQYIGDASGNVFSNFAQSLTLSNLIGLANARLSILSDRYILDKPRNESEALYVLDTYHGNQARAVSTLSGGETFTVSLALALALSDLASRNVRLDSLFIDEGFGTLDAETLESAVSILERLQDESNKVVGVISHRQEMKERIPVQIQIDKGPDGTSSVMITG